MKCSFCGAENPESATDCSTCLRRLGTTMRAPKGNSRRIPEFHPRVQRMIPKTKTVLPVAAGGILVLGAIATIAGLWIANVWIGKYNPEASDSAAPVILLFSGLAIFVLIGGCLAMLRRGWGIALVASIASFFLVLMFGFLFGVVGAMLSVAALILLIQSRHEFEGHDRAD